MRRAYLTLVVFTCLAAHSGSATADDIFIFDGDLFGIDGARPTVVVQRNGVSVPVTVLPDTKSEFLHFLFTSRFPAAVTGSVSRDLLEASGEGTAGTYSDRFKLSFTGGGFVNNVTFASDPATVSPGASVLPAITENNLYQPVLQTFFVGSGKIADQYSVMSDGGKLPTLVETGGPQSVSALLGTSYFATFQSDVDESEVPGDRLAVRFPGEGLKISQGGEHGQLLQAGYSFTGQTMLSLIQFNEPGGGISDYVSLWQDAGGKQAITWISDTERFARIAAAPLVPEVPEPSSVVTFAIGLAGVAGYGCYRSRRVVHRGS